MRDKATSMTERLKKRFLLQRPEFRMGKSCLAIQIDRF